MGCAVLGCSAAPLDTAAPGGGTRPLPPATPRPPILVQPEQDYVTPRVPYAPPAPPYTPPPAGAAPPSGSRSQTGLVAAVLAVAAAVVALTVILLVHNGSGANGGTPVAGSTGPSSSTGLSSSTGPRALVRGLIGSWRGVVTQYTPGGSRQKIDVRSQITSQSGRLVGQHSETTITGSGVGQICEGQMRQRAQRASTVSFDYVETLNPVSCISHTVISFTRVGAGRVAFRETYQTKIGPGQLLGELIH